MRFRRAANETTNAAFDELRRALDTAALPAMPAAVTGAIERLADPDFDLGSVADILSRDPGVSAKLLAVANSVLFAPRSPVTGVAQAAMMLGRNHLESVLLSLAAGGAINRVVPPDFDIESFWTSAALGASVAGALSDRFDRPRRSENFTASLLSDLAVPVLHAVHPGYPEFYRRWAADRSEPLAASERALFGWTHGMAAASMFEQWRFPQVICMAVAEEGDPAAEHTEFPIVRFAAALAEADPAGSVPRWLALQAETMWGLSVDDVEEVVAGARLDSAPMVESLAA